jgi:hypothetical protein
MKNLSQLVYGLIAALALFPSLARAQPRHSEEIVSLPPVALSAADAAKELSDFRNGRLDGDFCLQFNLSHLPRQGDAVEYTGVAWGTWNDQGPLTRFRLSQTPLPPAAGQPATPPVYWEWLVQNGPSPRIWVLEPGAKAAREVPPAQWRAPLFPGTDYTPFDLLMPFLYWTDSTYVGPARVLGRGVDIFTLKPPAAEQAAAIGSVRVAIDRDLRALVRTEQLDPKGALFRQFELDSFAKVEGQWIIQACELQNVTAHDYDRFEVKQAALKLKLDAAIFDPAKLTQPASMPPPAAWSSL